MLPTSLSFSAKDWEPSPLPEVLVPTATPAFDSDRESSDVDEDEPGGLLGSMDVVSQQPLRHSPDPGHDAAGAAGCYQGRSG